MNPLLRRWAVTQSHIMSGRLGAPAAAAAAAAAAGATPSPPPPRDGAAADQCRRTSSSSSSSSTAPSSPSSPSSQQQQQQQQQQQRPPHHLPPAPRTLGSALASAGARLLARCGVAAATAGAEPRFTNPWPTWTGDKTLAEVVPFLRAMRERAPDGALEGIPFPTQEDYRRAFPLVEPDLSGFPAARDQLRRPQPPPSPRQQARPEKDDDAQAPEEQEPDVRAVWLGHASVLARLNGLTFLTDPALSERCSPLPFAGPRRVVPPALTPATLPHVDAVLLSHNHYDHLDTATVKALHARFGPQGTALCPERGPLRWFVPLGLKAWFVAVLGEGARAWVTELDWWQEAAAVVAGPPGSSSSPSSASSPPPAAATAAAQTRVVLVPAQHWSARGALDRRATLWGGFCVIGPKGRFYFAGDTGHCPAFREIGDRLGPFDLAAIPTGAYEPRDFMRAQHVGPGEAVAIHREVRARRSIAVHCCTWCLTLEPLDEPPRLLRQELARRGMSASEFVTLRHGAGVRVVGGEFAEAPLTLPAAALAAGAAEAAAAAAAAPVPKASSSPAAPCSPSSSSPSPRGGATVALRADASAGAE